MLFKKGVLPVSKDIVAETYQSELESYRKKIKEKTDEIRECLKNKRAKSIELENTVGNHDENSDTQQAL